METDTQKIERNVGTLIFDMKSIAIICTWPWGILNAETEFICRLKAAARHIGISLSVITKEGYLVDEDFTKTEQRIDPRTLDFVIAMHYEDVKLLDTFYYNTVWIPLDIMIRNAQYPRWVQNLLCNDDFLIYDEGGMRDYMLTFLQNKSLDLNHASLLTPSVSETMMLPPALPEKPSLFYCGSNWEKVPRHKGLFLLLDQKEYARFYGSPQKWKGYRSFKGGIPFDGQSVLTAISKCGVVLAINGEKHHWAGAVTNRFYEGCASGAVIMTDTNPFIKKHWGDSVFYIDVVPEHPEYMLEQIDRYMQWIIAHPQDALSMARRSQQIFKEKFTLEKQLTDILNNHPARREIAARASHAQNQEESVLGVLFLDSPQYGEKEQKILQRALENVGRQLYRKITLAVCCEETICAEVKKTTQKYPFVRLFDFKFYGTYANKVLSRAQAFFQINKQIPHDYVLFMEGLAEHFSTHVTELKRALEDKPESCAAYCGLYINTPQTEHAQGRWEPISHKELYQGICPDNKTMPSDMFLMRAGVENLPQCTHRYIDNMLPNALLMQAVFNQHQPLAFVPRVSCGQTEEKGGDVFAVVKDRNFQLWFIQGLVRREALPLIDANTLPSETYRYVVRWVKSFLTVQIALHRLRFHLVFNKKTKQRVAKRLEEWNDIRNKLNETLY